MTASTELPSYLIWVAPEGPFDEYIDSTTDALGHALQVLDDMGKMPGVPAHGHEFMFADRDELRIEDDDGYVIKTWSREKGVIVENLEDRDDADVIGWQILNADGHNIHGDDDDPFSISSISILVGEAARLARNWAMQNPGYSVGPVKRGDIEEPEWVSEVAYRTPAPR